MTNEIGSSIIFNQKLNQHVKLMEIEMVCVGFVEDERTFNILSFMKNKLWNKKTMLCDFCIQMFINLFFHIV